MDAATIKHQSAPSLNNWCHALCSGPKTAYLKAIITWLAESKTSPLRRDHEYKKDDGSYTMFLGLSERLAYLWMADNLLNVKNRSGKGIYDESMSQCAHLDPTGIHKRLDGLGAKKLAQEPMKNGGFQSQNREHRRRLTGARTGVSGFAKGETSRINMQSPKDINAFFKMVVRQCRNKEFVPPNWDDYETMFYSQHWVDVVGETDLVVTGHLREDERRDYSELFVNMMIQYFNLQHVSEAFVSSGHAVGGGGSSSSGHGWW